MPPGSPLDHAKRTCAICAREVEGAPLTDERTGRGFHPECVVGRAPEDALVRLLGFLALIAAPTVLVWAG
jgi:hypothetical protein